MVREGRVFISSGSKPDFGSTYSVQVLEIGAQVTSGSSGTTITVRAGHGFAAGDKVMRGTDVTTFSATNVVASVTSTTVVMNSAYTVAAGDLLVNLAVDSSTAATPNYDGAGLTVYTTMDYTATATNNTVQSDANGRYRYYHKGIARWELVRSSLTVPIALYVDTSEPSDGDQVSYSVRYAHLFAASGTGTSADPFPGSAILAAWNDIPKSTGGKVVLGPYVYDLGSGSIGLNLDYNGTYASGFVLEGSGCGNEETGTVGPAFANDGGTILLYSGTGEAVRVGDFATSGSQWVESFRLSGFKIRQTGTAGTGIGLLLRLFRWSVVEDVNVVDFSVGIATASVSDFNQLNRVRTRDCQTYGVEIGRATNAAGGSLGGTVGQCNGTRLVGADIMLSNRDNGYSAWGVFIHGNSVANTIRDSEFHNFDKATGSSIGGFGAILSNMEAAANPMTTIDANYFEGCFICAVTDNPFGVGLDDYGFTFTNNLCEQIEGKGCWINSGLSGHTSGIVVMGNTFHIPSASSPYNQARAIEIGTYIDTGIVMANSFLVGAVAGSFPQGNVAYVTGILAENHLVLGSTRFLGAMGITGALTVTGNIAGSGSIRGLKATEALTTSAAITTAGRMLIDITNTSGSNTPTLVAPSSVDGQILILRCVALTAGTITLADSGNVALSAAWIPDAGDTLTLIASGVIFYEIARSAN